MNNCLDIIYVTPTPARLQKLLTLPTITDWPSIHSGVQGLDLVIREVTEADFNHDPNPWEHHTASIATQMVRLLDQLPNCRMVALHVDAERKMEMDSWLAKSCRSDTWTSEPTFIMRQWFKILFRAISSTKTTITHFGTETARDCGFLYIPLDAVQAQSIERMTPSHPLHLKHLSLKLDPHHYTNMTSGLDALFNVLSPLPEVFEVKILDIPVCTAYSLTTDITYGVTKSIIHSIVKRKGWQKLHLDVPRRYFSSPELQLLCTQNRHTLVRLHVECFWQRSQKVGDITNFIQVLHVLHNMPKLELLSLTGELVYWFERRLWVRHRIREVLWLSLERDKEWLRKWISYLDRLNNEDALDERRRDDMWDME